MAQLVARLRWFLAWFALQLRSLRNVGLSPNYAVLQSRSPHSSQPPL
jgi:hypothetical protein